MSVVAFDLDGTLIDSVPAILPSVQVAMAQLGLPRVDQDDLRFLIGPPLLSGFVELLRRLGRGPELAEDLVVAYRADYVEHMLERTLPFAGVDEVLRTVAAERGACIVTSKPAALATPIVEHLGWLDVVAFVEGPPLVGDEPKTVTLGRALERLDIGVIVGDRHHDLDAGTFHGLATVGVLWGLGDAEELAAADHVVATPDDLLAVLR